MQYTQYTIFATSKPASWKLSKKSFSNIGIITPRSQPLQKNPARQQTHVCGSHSETWVPETELSEIALEGLGDGLQYRKED